MGRLARKVGALGRIDVLVNAAGVGSGGLRAHELPGPEWERVVDINLKGSFLVAKHVLPAMLAQRAGSIVHLASVEGLEGMSGSLAYNASKGGVVLMTKNMALDYAKDTPWWWTGGGRRAVSSASAERAPGAQPARGPA